MGAFCAATGYTPEEFYRMTFAETDAIARALNGKRGEQLV